MEYMFEDAEHDTLQEYLNDGAKRGWTLHSVGRYAVGGFWLIWQRRSE